MHPYRSVRRGVASYVNEPMKRLAFKARFSRVWWRRRFAAFGPHSILQRPDWLYGPHHISIGDNVIIYRGQWLSAERSSWTKPTPTLQIGDGVIIRAYCTISASESIVIEDNAAIGSFSTIIDSDHVHSGTSDNIVWGGKAASTPVRIGTGTWVGERVAILRGADIGKFCTIGANSVVRGKIPDYSVAVGVPARVVGSTMEDRASDTTAGGQR